MKNISLQERLLNFFLDVLIVALGNAYVDAQSYVTTYWREIKDKLEFEQIANNITLEWNNKSLKRKASLFSYWQNLEFVTNGMKWGKGSHGK